MLFKKSMKILLSLKNKFTTKPVKWKMLIKPYLQSQGMESYRMLDL